MMDKKTLRKIPREAPTEKIRAAARLLGEGSFVATARNIGGEGSGTMQLYFYENAKSEAREYVRVFVNKDDYITQDLRKDKTHWLTGKIFYVLHWWGWSSEREIIRLANDKSREVFDSFIPDDGKSDQYASHEDAWVYRLWRWQEEIAEKRLQARHREVLEKSEAIAKLGDVPLPDDFDEWIRENVHHNNYYLQYEPSKKREITGYCSHCRKMVTLDRKKDNVRMFHKGTCPACGVPVTFVTGRNVLDAGKEVAVIAQKVAGGTVFRYFFTWMEAKRVLYFLKSEAGWTEVSREFDFDDGRREIVDWGCYKNDNYETWCPHGTARETFSGAYISGEHVYTRNLREVLADTKWKYSGIVEYQEKAGYRPIRFSVFMYRYPKKPYLEYLAKAGFINLLNDVCDRYGSLERVVDESAKSPVQLLGIPKAYIRILRRTDGGEYMLSNLRQCARDHVVPDDEEIKQYTELFGSADRMLEVIDAHTDIGKFLNYLGKQLKSHKKLRVSPPSLWERPERGHMEEWKKKEEFRLLANDWMDYIKWITDLGYDLGDKYYLLPPDLEKAHDKMLAEYQKKRDEIEKKKKEAEERLFKEMMEQAELEGKENEVFGMHSKKYMVVLPKTADDLKREGSHNHNCVGTYIGRVAEGKTMILFIRRVDAPDEPFYTMEYHNGKTIQCRGMRNVPAEGDVYAFSKAVERRLRKIEQEAAKSIGKDEAKRCRIAVS